LALARRNWWGISHMVGEIETKRRKKKRRKTMTSSKGKA